MRKIACKSKKNTVVLAVMLLGVTILWLSPRAMATTAVTINPNTGTVGTMARVSGTIDTFNGPYVIRWNQILNITSGFAVEYNVSASFGVPPTAGNSTGRAVLIELIDSTTNLIGNATFKLYTAYYIKAITQSPPKQSQVGDTAGILVNVTGGMADTLYVANVTVKNPANKTNGASIPIHTNASGYGGGNLSYPGNFTEAHTNYTGTYQVAVALNETVSSTNFILGLTNTTEYKRFEVVNVRAMNYTAQPQEQVWVNVTISDRVVFSERKNSTVVGVVETFWRIPGNATIGTYRVSVTNSTAFGSVKSVPDVQTFKIVRSLSSLGVRVENTSRQPMAGITVEIYNVTRVSSKTTGIDGWVEFSLDVGNYTVKGLVYDLLLNTTFVDVVSAFQPNITIVCPTYTLFVQVSDSRNYPSEDVRVSVDEWTSGVGRHAQSSVTNPDGNATFSLTFGRYRFRVYKDSVLPNGTTIRVLLNETTIDLTKDNTFYTIRCNIYNVDLSVFVTGYFGQPIPNAVVKFERKVDGDYVEAYSSPTGSGGSAVFNGIIGGNARISVYIAGKLSQTQHLYLDSSGKKAEFRIDGYVVVGGFVLEASQFFTLAVVLIIIALFLIISKYKSVLRFFGKRKKTP